MKFGGGVWIFILVFILIFFIGNNFAFDFWDYFTVFDGVNVEFDYIIFIMRMI